jgi:hypothetical protein
MAISFAFDCNTAESARFYQRVFDRQATAFAFDQAAGTANALGRVYLECAGDIANAQKWYETGRQMAGRIEKLPEDQADLWTMRWHHAASRLAIRRGDKAAADREMRTLKTLVDKNAENAKQMPIYQYLAGYVALYGGDYDTAIAELTKGDQGDAFIVGLIAQAYEKKGDKARAGEYWRKVLAITTHNINNAFWRDQARKAVAGA